MFKLRNHHAHIRLIWLMLLCIMVAIPLLSGCSVSEPPIASGTYITTGKQGHNDIVKVKLNLTEINAETFQNSDGCNVIKVYGPGDRQYYFRNKPYYYAVEFFLYTEAHGNYEKVDIISFERRAGTPLYDGKVDADVCDFLVDFIDGERILIDIMQDNNICSFYLNLESD